MKKQKLHMKAIALFTTVVTLAILVVCFANRVTAVEHPESLPAPFGLARDQTVRLNVLNSGEERGYIIDWKFLDTMGGVVFEGPQPHLIPTDQFRSFDLDGDALAAGRDSFGRIQLRAVVTALGGPDTKNLHVSIEVIDNATGRTTFIATNPSNDK